MFYRGHQKLLTRLWTEICKIKQSNLWVKVDVNNYSIFLRLQFVAQVSNHELNFYIRALKQHEDDEIKATPFDFANTKNGLGHHYQRVTFFLLIMIPTKEIISTHYKLWCTSNFSILGYCRFRIAAKWTVLPKFKSRIIHGFPFRMKRWGCYHFT